MLARGLPGLQYVYNITNFPKSLGHFCCHGWRSPQRLMDADEIVVHREQCNECAWFSTFFENALVSRVRRRVSILTLRLERSAYDVLMCFGST